MLYANVCGLTGSPRSSRRGAALTPRARRSSRSRRPDSRRSTIADSGRRSREESPLWEKAQAYCLAPAHVEAPNCRIVIAVDVTVRVIPVRSGEDPTIKSRSGCVEEAEKFLRTCRERGSARSRRRCPSPLGGDGVGSTILNDIRPGLRVHQRCLFGALFPIAQAVFWTLVLIELVWSAIWWLSTAKMASESSLPSFESCLDWVLLRSLDQ